ncbi:MAG: phosphodiester glycosidase family protein, partial [Gallicola sp.]|nr:phosphodiester glycosidase family protein [Gallicola sp.]
MNIDGNIVALPTREKFGNFIMTAVKEMFIDEISHPTANIVFAGNTYTVKDFNNIRKVNELILYNQFNGNTTQTSSEGTEVVVAPVSEEWKINTPIELKVINVNSNRGNTIIPRGSAVLSGHGTSQAFLDKLKARDKITFEIKMQGKSGLMKNPLHTVGAQQLILKNANLTDYVWDTRHPRTALGLSADRKKLYMCVVDGRYEFSKGVTVTQLALIMKRGGVSSAFNLDGGGSSTMYIHKAGYNGTGLMNRPLGGTITRYVANAFFATTKAPKDSNVKQIVAQNYNIHMKKGETVKLQFYGLNQYGLIVNDDVQGVQLTPSFGLGNIQGSDFTASRDR